MLAAIGIRGIKINYEYLKPELVKANMPLLVFLHEGLGSIKQWKSFPQALCNHLQAPGLVFDRYGYGQSTHLMEQRNSFYLEQEGSVHLPAFLKSLNVEREVVLIGHSDGASIALIYAGLYPQKVKAVVSVAAHLFLEEISIKGIENAIVQYKSNPKLKLALQRYHGAGTESAFFGWATTWTNPDFKKWNIEKYLPTITAPTLAIQGNDDEYGSEAQVDAIVQQVAGPAQKWMINDCGHSPHLEKPQMVIDKICSFLQNVI